MQSGRPAPNVPKRGQLLLVATWLAWIASVVATPLSAYLMHALVSPDEDDDFGLGPVLSGAMLGGVLSLVFGVVSLASCARLRSLRPLGTKLLILERLVLISPPTALLVIAGGLVGVTPLWTPLVCVAAAAMVLVQLRR